MKSYKEMAEEAIRRRDSYLKLRLEKIKKSAVIVTAILLFTTVGFVSFMIGVDRKEAPIKPPKVTHGLTTKDNLETKETINVTETDENSTTEREELNSESESESTESIPQDTESSAEITEPQVTESEPQTTEKEPYVTESEPQTTEREPYVTESEPQTTESEPHVTESEPQTTEREPNVTEKDPEPTFTLGKNPVELGSLGSLIYYPESGDTNVDTSGGQHFENQETGPSNMGSDQPSNTPGDRPSDTPNAEAPNDTPVEPIVEYYELEVYPVLYVQEGDNCFFANNYEWPEQLPLYVPTHQEFDLHQSIRDLANKLGATCDEGTLSELDLENGSCRYQLNDAYSTLLIASRKDVYIEDMHEFEYHSWLAMQASNVEPAKNKYFTCEEIYDYVVSLPHFQIALSYVGIEEYSVLKEYTPGEDGKYRYDFTFIPKTDDPIEAYMYRSTKSVRIAGNIGCPPDYCPVYFEMINTPYEIGEYTEYKHYNDVYDSIAAEMEKFGILEYFEDNFVCFVYIDSFTTKPIYQFYLTFIDDDGRLACCEFVVAKKYEWDGQVYSVSWDYIGSVDLIK